MKIYSQSTFFLIEQPTGSQGTPADSGGWDKGRNREKKDWRRKSTDSLEIGSERGMLQQLFCYRAVDETGPGAEEGEREVVIYVQPTCFPGWMKYQLLLEARKMYPRYAASELHLSLLIWEFHEYLWTVED